MVIATPSPTGPLRGITLMTVGGGRYVKRSPALGELVPPGVVTSTSTTPVPGGETAVIDSTDSTANLRASVAPKRTALAAARFVPLMVMVSPPAWAPLAGSSAVTAGASGSVMNV